MDLIDDEIGLSKKETLQWHDNDLISIAEKDFFPSIVANNIAVHKQIISRFLDFYLGAKARKGITAADLVFSVLSIIPGNPKSDASIWNRKMYRENGTLFFLSPEDRLSVDLSRITKKQNVNVLNTVLEEDSQVIPPPDILVVSPEDISSETNETKLRSENTNELISSGQSNLKSEDDDKTSFEENTSNIHENEEYSDNPKSNPIENFPEKIIWYGMEPDSPIKFKLKTNNKRGNTLEYGPVQNAAFITSVHSLLERWEADANARAMLKYFFGVICLVLTRATTKSYKHLENIFSNEKFLNVIEFSKEHIKFSTPHKRCLKACYRIFRRKDDNIRIMFAKLIGLGLILNDTVKLKHHIRYALLFPTAGFGLNLVNMYRAVDSAVDDEEHMRLISRVTFCGETEKSWCRLRDFFNEYMSPASKSRAHHWARVLDSRYFSDLSCQQNYELAVILAVFVEQLTGNEGIWMARWVEHENLMKYKKIGNEMYDKYIQIAPPVLRPEQDIFDINDIMSELSPFLQILNNNNVFEYPYNTFFYNTFN